MKKNLKKVNKILGRFFFQILAQLKEKELLKEKEVIHFLSTVHYLREVVVDNIK